MASPLRLSYEETSDTVAVASMSLDAVLAGSSNQTTISHLSLFSATSRQRKAHRIVNTARGVVNPEGMDASKGLVLTGGFDIQVRPTWGRRRAALDVDTCTT